MINGDGLVCLHPVINHFSGQELVTTQFPGSMKTDCADSVGVVARI
jgi:hypothetical protein